MMLAVVGPTGVGKTKLSLALAKRYKALIINCDAVQIYRELNIGSAKVTPAEMGDIPHYLIDWKNPDEEYTVKDYQTDFRKIVDDHPNQNIIIVGGTGLYLTAAISDYDFNPTKKQAPRVIYDLKIIGLTADRALIYRQIDQRVDEMIAAGLVAEVATLYQKYPESKVLKRAIGYKEIIAYLEHKTTLAEAIAQIKQNSRHYAKRQFTWFKHKNNVKWFTVDYENFEQTINNVIKYVEGETDEEVE